MRINKDGILLCPDCGFDYLHQVAVEVKFRDNEDGDGTQVICSQKESKITRFKNEDEKRTRRDIIFVYFTCENCDGIKRMVIDQHKGQTIISLGGDNGS